MFTVFFISRYLTLMKAQLFFGVVSVFVALDFNPRRRASSATVRPWQPLAHRVLRYVIGMMVCVLAGDRLMVRGQDCGVNAATLHIQIYDILCERVTRVSLLFGVIYGNMALYLLTCVI